jgi:two-component system chemotaxis response regulator CheY
MSVSLLICDDSNMARKQLLRLLPEAWQARVTLACNGREGLEAIRAGKGELIFLDLTMPELDGYEVLQHMQREGLGGKAIVISADIQPEARARVLALGAVDFIRKPVAADTLHDVLQRHGFL